jgi:hypothetical protein
LGPPFLQNDGLDDAVSFRRLGISLTWLRPRISYLKQAFSFEVRLECARRHVARFPAGFLGQTVSNRKQKVS